MINKKTFLPFLLLAASSIFAQQKTNNEDSTVNQIVQTAPPAKEHTDDVLRHIHLNTDSLIQNTTPKGLAKSESDDWISLLIGVILSFIVSALTLIYSYRTWKQQEVSAIALKEGKIKSGEQQKKIFIDLVRHLYRNKVCICAVRFKLSKTEGGLNRFYPSEEHLLKLKMLPEDLRLDKFENMNEHYDRLHQLELLFRNYNTEIEVSLSHLKQPDLAESVKQRDIDVIDLKSGLITKSIVDLMDTLNFSYKNDIDQMEASCKTLKEKLKNEHLALTKKEKFLSQPTILRRMLQLQTEIDETLQLCTDPPSLSTYIILYLFQTSIENAYKNMELTAYARIIPAINKSRPKEKPFHKYYDTLHNSLTYKLNRDIAIEYTKRDTIHLIAFPPK
jgi:hypothetical protein